MEEAPELLLSSSLSAVLKHYANPVVREGPREAIQVQAVVAEAVVAQEDPAREASNRHRTLHRDHISSVCTIRSRFH